MILSLYHFYRRFSIHGMGAFQMFTVCKYLTIFLYISQLLNDSACLVILQRIQFHRNPLFPCKLIKMCQSRVLLHILPHKHFPWQAAQQHTCRLTDSRLYQIDIFDSKVPCDLLCFLQSALYQRNLRQFGRVLKACCNRI